ncbi:MAG: DUF192 domain-containing protein [Halolamina sp.]
MNTRAVAVSALVAVALVAGAAVQIGVVGDETTTATVTVVDGEGGDTLATVSVAVADTDAERYTGLSDTDSLDRNEGMLFVHPEEGRHTYVMRDMAFPLDIVFVAADGTVTMIHHAPVESDDDLTEYRGRGKYVLEVPRGFANRTGLSVGDRVVVPEEYRKAEE